MKLRNGDLAVVDRQKVVAYLLNRTHQDNGGKAQFFESLGFSSDHPERLEAALRAIATSGEVVEEAHSQHGQKYVVDGWLSAHTEQNWERLVRTVWIIDEGHQAPRLVTAYPGKE